MTDFTIKAVYPGQFKDACIEAEKLFALINAGKVPETIVAWMAVTKCLRVLRAIFGGDDCDVGRAIVRGSSQGIGVQ